MPHTASKISNIIPIRNFGEEGPSSNKLSNLPDASPPIKKTLTIVAKRQYLYRTMPNIQIVIMAKYKPVMALKIFLRSGVVTVKSKKSGSNDSGAVPYMIATGNSIATVIIKWIFLAEKIFVCKTCVFQQQYYIKKGNGKQ